jgi:predicted nucleic acid-binding protein
MVAAVRQIVTVQSDGRIEIIAPELRAGTVTEVIVLLPPESTMATPAERVAALARLRESIGLTAQAADVWVKEVRAERDAWSPTGCAMIHLDTNYLIRSLVPNSAQAAQLDSWALAGETISTSAMAWSEFLCGPLSAAHTGAALAVLSDVEPVTAADAALAADLFNKTGRRRGSLADCIIAAIAIRSGASLATENQADFTPSNSAPHNAPIPIPPCPLAVPARGLLI